MNAPTDSELLIRSRTDAEAFTAIYQRHASAVFMFVARRIGSDTAHELLSEVFMRALEARHRARPHDSGSALPWLYGIARNVVRTTLRSPKTPVIAPSPPFDWAEVDARLDATAMSADLRSMIAALTEQEREVLLLVSWEQLTIGEVAEVLGISANTARQRLHRARARAAAALAAVPHPFNPRRTDMTPIELLERAGRVEGPDPELLTALQNDLTVAAEADVKRHARHYHRRRAARIGLPIIGAPPRQRSASSLPNRLLRHLHRTRSVLPLRIRP